MGSFWPLPSWCRRPCSARRWWWANEAGPVCTVPARNCWWSRHQNHLQQRIWNIQSIERFWKLDPKHAKEAGSLWTLNPFWLERDCSSFLRKLLAWSQNHRSELLKVLAALLVDTPDASVALGDQLKHLGLRDDTSQVGLLGHLPMQFMFITDDQWFTN